MNPSRLLIIAILLLFAGCPGREEAAPTAPNPSPPAKTVKSPDSDEPPGVIVYSTGEDVAWPSLAPWPMEISFDELPEVPEHILGPFSEDILPVKE